MISGSSKKEGETAYLKLDEYTPSWRQGLIVHASRKRDRFILAVRVLEEEISERSDEVTFFAYARQKFVLVEGKKSQLRESCPQPHRALEVSLKGVQEACQDLLEKDDLIYVTASDDVAEDKKSKTKKKEAQTSSSESETSKSDGDEILDLLMRAQKQKPERATGSDSKSKGGEKTQPRYALLAKKSKVPKEDDNGLEKLVRQACMEGGTQAMGSSLNALINLEMLKALKKGKKQRGHEETDDSSGAKTVSSTSSSEVDRKVRGAGKALRDFRASHRRMKKRPLRHVKKYIKEVEAVLGVSGQIPYTLAEYSKKLNWGKQKTLMRIHYALSELLQTLMRGKTERAALMTVQLLRAVHQVSLDQGSWQAASLMLAHADPLERPKFGGEPQQLESIASYLKAMTELEKRSQATAREEIAGVKGKGKGGKSKKEEDNEQ